LVTEAEVRERATAFGEALVAGNVDQAISDLSPELRRNIGEVLALFPLPATEVIVESVEHSGAGYNVVLRLVGETDEVEVSTRWKDRDGVAKVVEASHLSRTARAEQEVGEEATGDAQPAPEA
jgi:hypothetical protein